jgi:hypothetical protein
VLKKVVFYNVRKIKNWLWFEIIIIFKDKTFEFIRNQNSFKNSYLFKNDKEKTCHVRGQL